MDRDGHDTPNLLMGARTRMRLARLASLAPLLIIALLALPAGAQTFGKNKVHYESLKWAVLETPHLRVHYYAQEESLARRITAFAESAAVEFDGRFRMKFKRRIPLLLYSTHHLFQQTNVTAETITESVGGLTELIKGRVLIPHNGSWSRLRWVTRHELTHAYMLEKITQVQRVNHKAQIAFPPLWWIEGLAEYCGTTWDADAEGLLRDMVVNRRAYPITRSEPITGSVEMYKEGQAFMLWLAAHHGEHVIFDLLENLWRADDFETVWRITMGRSLRELDDEWFDSIQKRYMPTIATLDRPRDVARRLAQPSRFNLGPRAMAAAADTDTTMRYCWFGVDDGTVDLMLSDRDGRGRPRIRKLLRSGSTPMFESFHLFQNRPGVSRSGRIVLSAKRGGRDAISILDSHSGSVERTLEFPQLVSISDPVLTPDDSSVVFSAQDYAGPSDLYRATWRDGVTRLARLTRDDFDDLDPSITPDGRFVVFASDRADYGGATAIFRLSLAGGVPEQISFPPLGSDRQPVVSPDGAWIAYRSTRHGTSDLYVRPSQPSRDSRRLTRMLGPVSDPDWTWDGRSLLFTAQEATTFRTYRIAVAPDSLAVEAEVPPVNRPVLGGTPFSDPAQPYQRRLSLDLLQNGVVFDPGFGAGGAGSLVFSDVLGNEQFLFAIANDSEDFGDFWDGWEGGLTYFNQSRRLNYGIGVFRLTRLYDPDFDVLRREKRIGMLAIASYPFNRFTRIESSVQVRHATDHRLRSGDALTVDLVSNFVSLVRDDARWTWDGPIAGSRFNVTGGYTRDMATGIADYGTAFTDLRIYRQPIRRIVLATRAVAQTSFGGDAQRFYVGGPSRLRVPERRLLSGLQTVSLQEEVRFPLVRGLVLAVPAPWMLPTISGAVFADAAWVWQSALQQQHAVGGFGVYLGGGPYPAIRWNWIWESRDLRTIESRRPLMVFSIAYNY